jgi:hypothetical protein
MTDFEFPFDIFVASFGFDLPIVALTIGLPGEDGVKANDGLETTVYDIKQMIYEQGK